MYSIAIYVEEGNIWYVYVLIYMHAMCMYVHIKTNGGSLFEVANFILGISMLANSL